MFEQSLLTVNGSRKRKKFSVLASLVLECLLLGVAVLLPLIYTEVLPAARLGEQLTAPAPPLAPSPPAVVKVISTEIRRTPKPNEGFYQPPRIPKGPPPIIEDVEPPSIADNRPRFPGGVPCGGPGQAPCGTGFGTGPIAPIPPAPPPQVEAPKPQAPQRIKVGGNVQKANLIYQVVPVYPPLAKQTGIQGVVKLTAIISKDGTIERLEVINGHPMLIRAALEAVSQWLYKPTLLNGQPVEVITQIDVNFTLNR